jgi:hypothetical protein
LTSALIYMKPIQHKKLSELAPNTVKRYTTRLRALQLSLPALTGKELKRAKALIERYEKQLGRKAVTINGPGRPRVY